MFPIVGGTREDNNQEIDCFAFYYAPNFEEVEGGAYWFGPVRPSIRLSVRNTFWQLRYSRTAYARILKFYMRHVHEK